MDSPIDALAAKHRAALLARDAAAVGDLTRLYGDALSEIRLRLDALTELIDLREAAGEPVSLAWLNAQERYAALIAEIDRQTARLVPLTAADIIQQAANETARAGVDAAAQIAAAVGTSFNRLTRRAAEAQAGFLADGTPLADLLSSINAEAADEAKRLLSTSLVIGTGPREVARRLEDVLGVPLTRALRISRTERLRAYREGSLEAYRESRVVTGWRWTATKSARTCKACLAMDGRVFPLDVPFGAHVSCRCTPTPFLDGLPERESGEEWLARQDEPTQRRVMGDAFDQYAAGRLRLNDFIHETTSPVWGTQRREATIKQAEQNARRRSS